MSRPLKFLEFLDEFDLINIRQISPSTPSLARESFGQSGVFFIVVSSVYTLLLFRTAIIRREIQHLQSAFCEKVCSFIGKSDSR